MNKSEEEFKLASRTNTQFKYSDIHTHEALERKARALGRLLGITMGQSVRANIVDQYFDDDKHSLRAAGISLRKRRLEGRQLLTIKSDPKANNSGALIRHESEWECSDEEFENLTQDGMYARNIIKKALGVSVECDRLSPVLVVDNKRTIIPLVTNKGEYSFCYDKYYFYTKGQYSEFFSEIEIEAQRKAAGTDDQLRSMRLALEEILEYTINLKSKLDQGTEWSSRNGSDIVMVHTIMIDIIAYSTRTADVQKQIIQKLSRYVKRIIPQFLAQQSVERMIFLPTGDGMALVFESEPMKLVPMVFCIQRMVKEDHNSKYPDQAFEFRTGLHTGPVFRYSDINERLNYAGSGINLAQRVMDIGDEWHILATEDAYRSMGELTGDLRELFRDCGIHQLKHDMAIRVYNVYSKEDNAGNPRAP